MEVRVNMLQEESQITQCRNEQHAEDKRLKRLQWTVNGCIIVLGGLLSLTLYQMCGSIVSPKKEESQLSPYMNPGNICNCEGEKPRAHLTGTIQSIENAKDYVLQWESRLGLAFAEDGMQYANKSILITKEGYYFVYSQVSLKTHSGFGNGFTSQIIKVNENYPTPEILFSAKILVGGHQPLYMGGLIHLTKRDQLQVTVSAVEHVDISSNHKTFFGAFWIAG
ncbi:tumor necrosis factor ligand superfamily member 15 [Hyperolius riggenbachi]|uniref:tumor necrosis factor ligand superfamily member 15 n=1 Tax=Hyperolius riggenbachi TaxID=752182 RepID=UPI0035A32AB6